MFWKKYNIIIIIMINQGNVEKTIYFSLAIQIITSLISFTGVDFDLEEKDNVLKDILKLELIVQIIETSFYLWVIYSLKNLNKMTSRRYIDWVITTPIMLISTIIFMKYQEYKENNSGKILLFYDFLKDNKENIIKIVIYNALMLLFGYLGETGVISKNLSIGIGFIFFGLSFKLIYDEYGSKSELGKKLFYFLLIVWSMYGGAATIDVVSKNISYNLLDIVSKNFYGLFIYYKIREISNENLKDQNNGRNGLLGSI